jgi:nucleoprotein TPR
MKTRRKSKAATAADSDNERETNDESLHTISIPGDIDLDSLSGLLPGANLSAPSSDEIIALYRLLLIQSLEGRNVYQELDEARAEVEKKEVELDQALQDREGLSRELETSLEAVQEELKKVKQERDELGMSFGFQSLASCQG